MGAQVNREGHGAYTFICPGVGLVKRRRKRTLLWSAMGRVEAAGDPRWDGGRGP
jgi:hypothetical protein